MKEGNHMTPERLEELRNLAENPLDIDPYELIAEIDRLRQMIESLPQFADGTIAYPGDEGWFPGVATPGKVGEVGLVCGNDEWGDDTIQCYPTAEAAAKAVK
jgi:hypothetical protein